MEVATAPEHAKRVAVEAMAAVALLEGDLGEAERGFGDAIALARGAGDRFHEAVVLGSRAIALGYLDRVTEAERATGDSQAVARALACPSLLAWALYARAERLVELHPAKALPLLDRSETLAKEVGNHFVRAVAGISATTIRARHGDPSAALPRFRELIEHLGRLGNRAQLWTMLRSLIQLLAQVGDLEAAAVLHGALEVSATAVPPLGPDHERLLEAVSIVARQAHPDELETWREHGRNMGDQEAIAYAIAAVDRICGTTGRP